MAEAEKEKSQSQVSRLYRENTWLRDELAGTQQMLRASQQEVARLDAERRFLEFMHKINRCEQDASTNDRNPRDRPEDDPLLEPSANGEAEERNDRTMLSTEPSECAQQSSADHKIPKRLQRRCNLVIQYAHERRYEIGVPLCKKVLEELEKTTGRDHPDVATMLSTLAVFHRDRKEYFEATDLMNDALAIREKTLGEKDPWVATTLNNIAVLHDKRGLHKEAESLCRRALEIRENVLGDDHPDVARQLHNIALQCHKQDKHEDAQRYYRRALEIYEAILGPDDQRIAKTKNNLASCYIKQGKYKEAEVLYKRTLTRTREKEFGAIDDDKTSPQVTFV